MPIASRLAASIHVNRSSEQDADDAWEEKIAILFA